MKNLITKKKFFIVLVSMIFLWVTFKVNNILTARTSIYRYDVKKDYSYSFKSTNANITTLTLKNGIVSLPKKRSTQQTAFLKLNISSSFFGKYLQPYIEIIGKENLIQFFEYGANGVRYLNISQIMSENELELKLKGKYIAINDQSVELIVFDNQEIKDSKILVIAPHPDDAEIAAFGLYSSNKNSFILTVCAGDGGGNKYHEIYKDDKKGALKKGELKTWNSITVPMLGGISPEQCINLGYSDWTLHKMYQSKNRQNSLLPTDIANINIFRKINVSSLSDSLSEKSDWNSLIKYLEFLLKTTKPDIIVTPYPALDGNIDHKFTSIALFEAIKKSGIKNGEFYFYTNHLPLSEYYPFGETGAVVSVPPNFGKEIYHNSIKSQPLSRDEQNNKLFALETNNDLRPNTEWLSSNGILKQAYNTIITDIYGGNNSYYKRAIRRNEFFFVVKVSNIYNQNYLDEILGKFEQL